MNKLGSIPIPETNYRKDGNKAQMARAILNDLRIGMADVYEFATENEAKNMRSMIASMAILKFGAGGFISTSLKENILTIWLKERKSEWKQSNITQYQTVNEK